MKFTSLIYIIVSLVIFCACSKEEVVMTGGSDVEVVEIDIGQMTFNDAHVDFSDIELESLSVSGKYSSIHKYKAIVL